MTEQLTGNIPLAALIISVATLVVTAIRWWMQSETEDMRKLTARVAQLEGELKVSEDHRRLCEKDLFQVMRRVTTLEEKTDVAAASAASARSTMREFMSQIGAARPPVELSDAMPLSAAQLAASNEKLRTEAIDAAEQLLAKAKLLADETLRQAEQIAAEKLAKAEQIVAEKRRREP